MNTESEARARSTASLTLLMPNVSMRERNREKPTCDVTEVYVLKTVLQKSSVSLCLPA